MSFEGIAAKLRRTEKEIDLCSWVRLCCSRDFVETANHLNTLQRIRLYPGLSRA